MMILTFILMTFLILTGCSNSISKIPSLPKFTMPDIPKIPNLSLPSLGKPKLPLIDIYKPSISQGSILDMKEVNQLQIGMSKEAVMNLIGSPSIIDPFHQYQWDYINHSTASDGMKTQYRLRLIFSDNILSEIDDSGLNEFSTSS